MGKKGGGSSWLTAVKRAFRSPSKEDSSSPPSRKASRIQEDGTEEDKVGFAHSFSSVLLAS